MRECSSDCQYVFSEAHIVFGEAGVLLNNSLKAIIWLEIVVFRGTSRWDLIFMKQLSLVNPFSAKLIQILPTIQEENDWVM